MGDFDSRYVSIEKEANYGVDPSASSAVAPKYGEVDDESFKHIFDTLVREDMSRYGAQKIVRGREYCEGSLNTVMMTDDFTCNLIRGLYATDTLTGSTPNFIHTLEEGDNGDGLLYPTFTVHIGRTGKDHTFGGMNVNRMSISAATGEFTSMSFDMQGKGETTVDTLHTPTFPTSEPCYFANAEVKFNNNATKSSSLRSIEFELSLDRDLDSAFSIGSLTLVQAPPVQRRSMSGTIEFNQAVYASSVGEPTYDQITQNSGNTFIYDAAVGDTAISMLFTEQTNRTIQIDLFKVAFEAPETSVSGRDHQTMTLSYMGLFNAANDAMSKTVITNGQANAY